jgi:hypothetical protein
VKLTALTDATGGKYVHTSARDGFALSILCDRCNSVTGSRLGTGFAAFAAQVQASGRLENPTGGVYVIAMDIFPSRVVRQLLLNYICIQDEGAEDWSALRQFIRSKEPGLPSDAPRVALYFNASSTYRVVPTGGVASLRAGAKGPWIGSEIAAPGLGVVYSQAEDARLSAERMIGARLQDISDWAELPFDRRERVQLVLSRLRVEVPHPLAFGRPADVDRWQLRHLIAWLSGGAEGRRPEEPRAVVWSRVRGVSASQLSYLAVEESSAIASSERSLLIRADACAHSNPGREDCTGANLSWCFVAPV